MPKSNADTIEPVNNYFGGGSRRASQLAQSVPARGAAKSISAARPKRSAKVIPMGPTAERIAKGDLSPRTAGGFHRAVPPVERLRDEGRLHKSDPFLNQAYFEAAEKLHRHFMGSLAGLKAADVSDAVLTGVPDANGLVGEEGWVHHFDTFRLACKLMGWPHGAPDRGAGRIVVAVVCYENTVEQAAMMFMGAGRTEVLKAVGMDRVREGLFALATHWKLC